MSLSLLQGYSSAEEEQVEEPEHAHLQYPNSSDDDEDDDEASAVSVRNKSFVEVKPPPSGSGLPSALEVFSEISGPPTFLNNSVEEYGSAKDVDHTQGKHGGRRNRKEKRDLPAGTVMESKAQLVGIHERVRSDIVGNQPPGSSVPSTTPGIKQVPTATNPSAEDAAELLRMCVQCGIPKTYSNARGMVCPVCRDRPPSDSSGDAKKKGSTVKDKEKSKRMRGQSSHATWKSETEMHLRQQFD